MRRFWATTIGIFLVLASFVAADFASFSTQDTVAHRACKRRSHKNKSLLPCTCQGVMVAAACTDCGENKKLESYPALQSDAEEQSCSGSAVPSDSKSSEAIPS